MFSLTRISFHALTLLVEGMLFSSCSVWVILIWRNRGRNWTRELQENSSIMHDINYNSSIDIFLIFFFSSFFYSSRKEYHFFAFRYFEYHFVFFKYFCKEIRWNVILKRFLEISLKYSALLHFNLRPRWTNITLERPSNTFEMSLKYSIYLTFCKKEKKISHTVFKRLESRRKIMTRVFFHDSFREISTNIMALSTLRTRMRIVGRVFKHGTQSSLEMIKLLLCTQQMSTNYTIIRERCCYGYFEPPTSATKQSIVTG